MKSTYYILLATALLMLSNCSIYRSPDRREFESDSPTFRTQNLVALGCSGQTLRSQSAGSRLVTILQNKYYGAFEFLWEHKVNDKSYFETDNLKGAYCVFENN